MTILVWQRSLIQIFSFTKKHYSDSELLVNSEAEIAKPKQKAGKKAAAK
jgi:hypothetical protein